MNFVPVIPENAPFTAEQRAYLNGFLAGLFSHVPGPAAAGPNPLPLPSTDSGKHTRLEPLAILVGSQTGNCEKLAKRLAKEAGRDGFAPTVHDLAKYTAAQLAYERAALIITSTYGDGEPPDNAKTFWDSLAAPDAPRLATVRFSLCALGDSQYPQFCGFGRQLDARLSALGAERVFPRVDCDVEYEQPFLTWMAGAVAALRTALSPSGPSPDPPLREPVPGTGAVTAEKASLQFSKENPFPARLKTNRLLNAAGSGKEVRHFEIALADSGLRYEAGDALGVRPRNDAELVSEILVALGLSGDETVPAPDGTALPLREALLAHYEVTRIPKPLLEAFAQRTNEEVLQRAAAPAANGALTDFLRGREIVDLLLAHPAVRFSPAEFVGFLRKLQPRLYSISSSSKAHPGEVHLTVATVRYESLGRRRAGVCSTFLADRAGPDTPVPVFVHTNHAFRPPPPDQALIMIGPGTGIAPFRAFLQERRATGASGRSWLFFGEQRASADFLYREEIENFQRDGLLTRLELAWSRDQADKVYVQHRMLERAEELFAWLEDGAVLYVCGDAARMAKDVDAALHEVIQKGGDQTPAQAAEYVRQLKTQKRYRRDVY